MNSVGKNDPLDVKGFMGALGLDEPPMGLYYTDAAPTEGFSPKPGVLPSVEAEAKELTAMKCQSLEAKGLLIQQWDLDALEADLTWCGRSGSPTKVHRIQSVVLAAKVQPDLIPGKTRIHAVAKIAVWKGAICHAIRSKKGCHQSTKA